MLNINIKTRLTYTTSTFSKLNGILDNQCTYKANVFMTNCMFIFDINTNHFLNVLWKKINKEINHFRKK